LAKGGPGLGVGEGDGVVTGLSGNGDAGSGEAAGSEISKANTSAINSKNLLVRL
jgi:hypothetical protein